MTDAAVARRLSAQPSADKREAILAAALRLIARLGLHATPMSAVAREAGVAAGTLYLYFPSKEAMINALYLEVLEDRDRSMAADAEGARRARRDRPRGAVGVLARASPAGISTTPTVQLHRPVQAPRRSSPTRRAMPSGG